MQTIQKKLSVSLPYQFLPDKSIEDSDILMFDIETTGFSPDISSIYLIGCCYYKNNSWNLIQFFADDYISEKMILQSFINFAKDFSVMVHFNGSGFDIPYLQKKMAQHQISFSFDSFLQLDLYKKIFPYKKILNLKSLKQKSIETFLGLPRMDEYSGGELIEVYVSYMKEKFGHNPKMEEDFQKLLLHNEEDVTNLILLTSVMAYSDLFDELPAVSQITNEGSCLKFHLSLHNPLTVPVQFNTEGLYFFAEDTSGTLAVTCYSGELRYFYHNYKDYYYLPQEDTAMHKSVAEFVDKAYRQKAKASNCYTRKNSVFLPQYLGTLEPSFRKEYKDKESYIELTEAFLSSQEKCSQYVSSTLQFIRHIASRQK